MGPLQTKWVEALRSGKYEQCQNTLVKDRKYCCLGVAAECLGIPKNLRGNAFVLRDDDNDYDENYVEIQEDLSCGLYTKLGLRSESGRFDNRTVEGKCGQMICLTELNDNLKWNFNQIADFIEANEEAVFEDEV